MTGTKRDRPELNKLLAHVSQGSTVVVESLSRLGRSTKDLIELVELMKEKRVQLVSLKEQIDTSTPAGTLLLTLISALAKFERDVIAERTIEGLKAARARGRKGDRPRYGPHKIRQALKFYEAGQHTVAEIKELTGLKKASLYRACKTRLEPQEQQNHLCLFLQPNIKVKLYKEGFSNAKPFRK